MLVSPPDETSYNFMHLIKLCLIHMVFFVVQDKKNNLCNVKYLNFLFPSSFLRSFICGITLSTVFGCRGCNVIQVSNNNYVHDDIHNNIQLGDINVYFEIYIISIYCRITYIQGKYLFTLLLS